MKTCPRSYAIVIDEAYSAAKVGHQEDRYTDPISNMPMAAKQLTWLVKKGDLVLKNEGATVEKDFTFYFLEKGNRKFPLSIYEYGDDDLPERYQNTRQGRHRESRT